MSAGVKVRRRFTANKASCQLSRILKEMNIRRRLNLADVFKGLRPRGTVEKSRSPFDAEFIQDKLLATGALDDLKPNSDAIGAMMPAYLVAIDT